RSDKEPFPWKNWLRIARGSLEGLAAIHREGFIHRDFKSANVLLTKAVVRTVADFGLANALHEKRARIAVSMRPMYPSYLFVSVCFQTLFFQNGKFQVGQGMSEQSASPCGLRLISPTCCFVFLFSIRMSSDAHSQGGRFRIGQGMPGQDSDYFERGEPALWLSQSAKILCQG
ncbi:unnamed protein product, partial [Closterium sp. NIES-54]